MATPGIGARSERTYVAPASLTPPRAACRPLLGTPAGGATRRGRGGRKGDHNKAPNSTSARFQHLTWISSRVFGDPKVNSKTEEKSSRIRRPGKSFFRNILRLAPGQRSSFVLFPQDRASCCWSLLSFRSSIVQKEPLMYVLIP